MATGNFAKENAKEYYTLCNDNAEAFCSHATGPSGWERSEGWESSSGSFNMHFFAESRKWFSYAGIEFPIDCQMGLRPGYYDGANLDYLVNFETDLKLSDGDTEELADEIMDYMDDYAFYYMERKPYSEGLYKMNRTRIRKALVKFLDGIVDECEKYMTEACDQKMGVLYRFCNGETIYAQIS